MLAANRQRFNSAKLEFERFNTSNSQLFRLSKIHVHVYMIVCKLNSAYWKGQREQKFNLKMTKRKSAKMITMSLTILKLTFKVPGQVMLHNEQTTCVTFISFDMIFSLICHWHLSSNYVH